LRSGPCRQARNLRLLGAWGALVKRDAWIPSCCDESMTVSLQAGDEGRRGSSWAGEVSLGPQIASKAVVLGARLNGSPIALGAGFGPGLLLPLTT
jgi:hypothetical protein